MTKNCLQSISTIRTLSSPYQVMYKVGAESYSKQVNLPLDVLTTEANSQKGLTDIKSEVARRGGNVAFFIDPNDASDAVPIAKTLEPAGVYFVTWWSRFDLRNALVRFCADRFI